MPLVDVDISDIDDSDLVDEMRARGYYCFPAPSHDVFNDLERALLADNKPAVYEQAAQLIARVLDRPVLLPVQKAHKPKFHQWWKKYLF
jgi:hypothetical protein